MQSVPSQLTPSYGCEHETMESSVSRASMTSEQRKLYLSGMYFPEKVIYTARLDVKERDQWDEDCPIRLTSQAFGTIPLAAISKIKYYRNAESQKLSLKIIAYNQENFFHVSRETVAKLFGMLVWAKLATMNIFSDMEEDHLECTKGKILKKSGLFNAWEPCSAAISKEKGLEASKDEKSAASHVVGSTGEVWTRFETTKSETHLIFKLWQGLVKREYAVPTCSAARWAQAFCSLLLEKQ